MKARVQALAANGTPRNQAIAALFSVDLAGGDVLAGMSRQSNQMAAIAASARDDALLAWLVAQQCRSEYHCDEGAAIDHAVRQEPDNMAVWLLAVDRAMGRDDETEADRLLHRAAKAPRMDFHWSEQGLAVLDALSALRVPSCDAIPDLMGKAIGVDGPATPDDMAALFAIASANAMAFPLLAHRLCPSRGSIPATRLPACRAVFARMADGNELVTQAIGISRLAAWADTPAERAQWRERQRNQLWLQEESRNLWRPTHMRMMLEQGEVPFLIALLEEQGRWPAPEGWLPDEPYLRAQLEGTP